MAEVNERSAREERTRDGRTEPYSCTEFRLSAFHFDHSLLCMKNGSSLSSSFPIDCLRADPHKHTDTKEHLVE